jgi:hypothetical protein
LNDITTEVLGGKMKLIGTFKSNGKEKARYNLKYDVIELPFEGVYAHIETIRLLAPLSQYVEGFFNSTLIVEGLLGKDMMPELSSLTASGYMETLEGKLGRLPFLDKMSNALAISKLSGVTLENTKNWFEIKDGSFILEPFDYTYDDINFKIAGKTTFDKSIDFDIKAVIPKEKLKTIPGGDAVNKGLEWAGSEASKLGFNVKEIDSYVFNIDIAGDILDPNIKVKLADINQGSAKDKIKDTLKDTLSKEKDRIVNEAKEEAEKKIDEARDTVLTRAKEEVDKVLDQVKEEVKKKSGDLIDSTIREKLPDDLQKKANEILDSSTKEKVEDIKGKIEKFNPFKKKKK